jgi:BirA family biotin operon repressor/biotin-[acetyl-CoA-carboxylase] ligase
VNHAPDTRPPLDPAALRDLPAPFHVEVVASAPSTNALVSERARAGEAEGLVVVAEHQTAGRGRLDREWVTPPRAAVTMSVLLRPRAAASRWPLLGLLAGLAVADGVAAVGGPPVSLKWPNDVLAHDGLKVAGLLLERVDGGEGAAAVVGIGLNVSTTRTELPVPTAGSLVTAGMVDPDRTTLTHALVSALASSYRDWEGSDDPARADARLLARYAERCDTLGRQVEVHLPTGEVLSGEATGLGAGGALVVGDTSGQHQVQTGDVVHVRVE